MEDSMLKVHAEFVARELPHAFEIMYDSMTPKGIVTKIERTPGNSLIVYGEGFQVSIKEKTKRSLNAGPREIRSKSEKVVTLEPIIIEEGKEMQTYRKIIDPYLDLPF